MVRKLMIYTMFVPDLATGTDSQNRQIPLGTIAGKGVGVPVVTCPKFGDRNPISMCLECEELKGIHQVHLECNYVTPLQPSNKKPSVLSSVTPVQPVNVPISPVPLGDEVTSRKLPDGVFRKE